MQDIRQGMRRLPPVPARAPACTPICAGPGAGGTQPWASKTCRHFDGSGRLGKSGRVIGQDEPPRMSTTPDIFRRSWADVRIPARSRAGSVCRSRAYGWRRSPRSAVSYAERHAPAPERSPFSRVPRHTSPHSAAGEFSGRTGGRPRSASRPPVPHTRRRVGRGCQIGSSARGPRGRGGAECPPGLICQRDGNQTRLQGRLLRISTAADAARAKMKP